MRAFEKKTTEAVTKAKTDTRPRAGIARDPKDAVYAAMANRPNPSPQPWMNDPAALPKRPPVKRHFD